MFSSKVESALLKAGWFPGRSLGDDYVAHWNATRPLFAAAEKALREFAGLYFPGTSRFVGNSKVPSADYYPQFCIDPILAWEMEDDSTYNDYNDYWQETYPLGLVDYSKDYAREALLIDVRGRVFGYHYQNVLIGETIEEAIENFILQKGMRLWLPGEE